MDSRTVETVAALCQMVASLCKRVQDEANNDKGRFSAAAIYYVGPSPRGAELKRRSMDLTRALARLRGRGRF